MLRSLTCFAPRYAITFDISYATWPLLSQSPVCAAAAAIYTLCKLQLDACQSSSA
jgi:hypothetical protein